ncbi:hypothetical protein [Glycomyces buryatensis]|uniref:Nucleotidyltransferase family protein n=1 Tax=Glycomyces buryatensis TaxID=2570927 RepID=A0A4S8Q7C8_9ACTN|nr:hypothetical protein [Glycomyces buryatensis]THV38622.1 hypothetical protein FAB82_19525 [Glycomyces buryatensis]
MAVDRSAAYDGVLLYKLVWRLVRDHRFDPNDFVLVGSARLWLEGIVGRLADIDIVARNETWERAQKIAHNYLHNGTYSGENTGAPVVQLYGKRIDVCPSWVGDRFDADELIDHADVISGLRHMSVADVVAYKRKLGRPKDRQDLARIRSRTAGLAITELPDRRPALSVPG